MDKPLLLEPSSLDEAMALDKVLLVDVTTPESYSRHHLPGAIYFDYKQLVSGLAPSPGKLPDIERLGQALEQTGITRAHTVIAYDDEGNGKASRLLWTLDILGFTKLHLINGGLHACAQAELGFEQTANSAPAAEPDNFAYDPGKIADKHYIMENLDNPGVIIWDVRSQEEYTGQKARARRNGHIPGAVNLNWLETIDMKNGLRYKPREQLHELLESKGIRQDKIIVPHCQTHHRSAHSAVLLKYLGYQQVKAYPGSWSEWGNSTDTPIES